MQSAKCRVPPHERGTQIDNAPFTVHNYTLEREEGWGSRGGLSPLPMVYGRSNTWEDLGRPSLSPDLQYKIRLFFIASGP